MILMTGNPNYGLAKAFDIISYADFVSRSNGFDLCSKEGKELFYDQSLQYDVVINSSALWQFNQSLLLNGLWHHWKKNNHSGHIISVGSTIDWSQKPRDWQYSIEKKALWDCSMELSGLAVWDTTLDIRVSYVSFGSLATKAVNEKHPDRTLMPVEDAAEYLKWVINSPTSVNINSLSVDPIQR